MKTLHILILIVLLPFVSKAKDYHASLFGAKSDGLTMNTGSIQRAIDYISANGGGRLVFYVGRYLTGAIQLKSNVTIKLEEGAVLVGSGSIYDYNTAAGTRAIISAVGQENIGISGKGVIEGSGGMVLKNMDELMGKGYLKDSLLARPSLIAFTNCSNIKIDSINLVDAAGAVQVFERCKDVSISTVSIKSLRSSDAATLFRETEKVNFDNSYIESAGRPLQWYGRPEEIRLDKTIDDKGKQITP